MSRKQIIDYKFRCIMCGGRIKQVSSGAKGFCIHCRNDVMKEWNNVSFEERIQLLAALKASKQNAINTLRRLSQ